MKPPLQLHFFIELRMLMTRCAPHVILTKRIETGNYAPELHHVIAQKKHQGTVSILRFISNHSFHVFDTLILYVYALKEKVMVKHDASRTVARFHYSIPTFVKLATLLVEYKLPRHIQIYPTTMFERDTFVT